MANYALFLDDSGTKEFAPSPEAYGNGVSRYFVFGGALLSMSEAGRLTNQIKQLKTAAFGDGGVEIKSNWLRMPEERNKRYCRRFGVSDADIVSFTNDLYDVILDADLRLFAAVVDKVHLEEDYPNPWYPPAVAYEILMQRIVMQVQHPHSVHVTIDDMMGTTPKHRKYRDNLERHHAQLRASGSTLLRGSPANLDFGPLCRGIRFIDSAVSNLIQVADLVAYNVFRQFRDHGHDWEHGNGDLPTYEWFNRIAGKFCQNEDGRIQGFGVAKFPLRKRRLWTVADE